LAPKQQEGDMQERILIVDDDMAIRDGCAQTLKRMDYEVSEAAAGEEAMSLLERYEYDLILLDLKMPDINGLTLLSRIKEKDSLVPVIMITAYGTIHNAVEAMRLGATDFLSKPFEPDELRMAVRRALDARRLTIENIYLKEELRKKEGDVKLIGQSQPMRTLMEQIRRVANTDSTVLITGESGTGKGLIARRIHELSQRKDNAFVSVDCSTLVPTLFESELFGHVKGAFTGASGAKMGKFELANRGTLFLDEIGNINLELQAKLLKAVEEKEITRVGSNRLTKVDVRIIAATNQDLKKAVQQGAFREDLYFRLNVVAIKTPPLRERREDIALLAHYFLRIFSEKHDRPGLYLTQEAVGLLEEYSWPGNVRELENTMERLAIFAAGPHIDREDVELAGIIVKKNEPQKEDIADRRTADPYAVFELMPLEDVERQYVLRILNETKGNRSDAARILGIDRKTLRLKLRRWGME